MGAILVVIGLIVIPFTVDSLKGYYYGFCIGCIIGGLIFLNVGIIRITSGDNSQPQQARQESITQPLVNEKTANDASKEVKLFIDSETGETQIKDTTSMSVILTDDAPAQM